MIKKYKPRLLTKESEGSSDEQDNSELTDNENTLGDVFQAIKRAILTVKEEEGNMESPPLFKTIAIDTG